MSNVPKFNTYYKFSILYPGAEREYLVDNISDYKEWVQKIKESIGYISLTDKYEILVLFN